MAGEGKILNKGFYTGAVIILLTPALLAIAGRAAFWPARVRTGPAAPGLWGRVDGRLEQSHELRPLLGRQAAERPVNRLCDNREADVRTDSEISEG